MTVGQCFNTNTINKLALCGTPSFPEGNVMHGKLLIAFKHWTLPMLGWHDTQVMSDPKPSMVDSNVHSIAVVVVVSECQGENHFQCQLNTDRSV